MRQEYRSQPSASAAKLIQESSVTSRSRSSLASCKYSSHSRTLVGIKHATETGCQRCRRVVNIVHCGTQRGTAGALPSSTRRSRRVRRSDSNPTLEVLGSSRRVRRLLLKRSKCAAEDSVETLLPSPTPVLASIATNRVDIRIAQFQLASGPQLCPESREQGLKTALTCNGIVQGRSLVIVQNDSRHGTVLPSMCRRELFTDRLGE